MTPYDFQGFDMVRKWFCFICSRHFNFSACYSIDEDTKQQKNEGKDNHISHDSPANCSGKNERKVRR